MTRLIATFFYVGYMRPAPGTWGSLAAVVVALPIIIHGGLFALGLGAVLAFAIGLWATQAETGPDNHDPSEIVIDEVAGQWIALLPVAWFYQIAEGPTAVLLGGSALAFGLFRLFDIWKPGPVGWADRRGDAMGVMLDDVIAGIIAAAIMLVALLALAAAAIAAVYG